MNQTLCPLTCENYSDPGAGSCSCGQPGDGICCNKGESWNIRHNKAVAQDETWKERAQKAEMALADAQERLQEQARITGKLESSGLKERLELLEALRGMVDMHDQLSSRINWGASYLDAEAIRMMNEAPIAARAAIAGAQQEL